MKTSKTHIITHLSIIIARTINIITIINYKPILYNKDNNNKDNNNNNLNSPSPHLHHLLTSAIVTILTIITPHTTSTHLEITSISLTSTSPHIK